MSSDNDNKPFLPKSLKEWLETLKILVPVGLAIWVFLQGIWQATEGDILVNTRLLVALSASTPMAFGALWWCSSRRVRRLRMLEDQRPKPLKLSLEEEKILKYFAENDPVPIPPKTIFSHLGLSAVECHHFWNQVQAVHKFVEFYQNHYDAGDVYMLSHEGREYVVKNGLAPKKGSGAH